MKQCQTVSFGFRNSADLARSENNQLLAEDVESGRPAKGPIPCSCAIARMEVGIAPSLLLLRVRKGIYFGMPFPYKPDARARGPADAEFLSSIGGLFLYRPPPFHPSTNHRICPQIVSVSNPIGYADKSRVSSSVVSLSQLSETFESPRSF